MRAAANVLIGEPLAAARLPIRMFGEIAVRSDAASTARTNAGGLVTAYRDSLSCVEVYP